MPTETNLLSNDSSSSSRLLPDEVFAQVVEHAPLVAIDLLVEDMEHRVLLGWRKNPPAQSSWFVPGGRVQKNETLDQAFARITSAELGQEFDLEQSVFTGVYQHFYPDNFRGDMRVGTHYIALAHRIWAGKTALPLPQSQHAQYRWAHPATIAIDPLVHAYTRAYFMNTATH
ncbi:GDP-mannose mannosyl hydrolase NudD [Oxalobacteraceae bacterium]|jgi:colanic acid biosynthesis protein WcaH